MQVKNKNLFKYLVPVLLGNMLEFYDIMLFGIFAPILSKIFYNTQSSATSVIYLSYITFAIGFFFRPFGSLYFGYISDIYGRKKALLGSVMLMAIATLGISILPGYEVLGYGSVVLVTVFRALQGFSAGGEYNNAAIYLIECNKKLKNINSALLVISGVVGSLIASYFYKLVITEGMPQWAWRIAFAFGACLAIIGLLLRSVILETQEFLTVHNKTSALINPIYIVLRDKRKELFTAFIIGGFNGLIYYFQFVFLVNYLPNKLSISTIDANYFNMIAMFFYAFGILINGVLANKFGVKNLMLFSCIGYAIFLIPLAEMLLINNLYSLCFYQIILACLSSCFCGLKHVFLAELFSTHIRSTGVSLGYGLGVAIFGGTAPFLLTVLDQYNSLFILIYVSLFAALCGLMICNKRVIW